MNDNEGKLTPKKHNKLVRDRIPEYIRQQGGRPVTHVADDLEYWLKLKAKLVEEVTEFLEKENVEELADVYEVLDAIIEFKRYEQSVLRSVQTRKAQERGKFQKRIILDES